MCLSSDLVIGFQKENTAQLLASQDSLSEDDFLEILLWEKNQNTHFYHTPVTVFGWLQNWPHTEWFPGEEAMYPILDPSHHPLPEAAHCSETCSQPRPSRAGI